MLTVTNSCHGMPCIQLSNAPVEIMRIIRNAVMANHMDDRRYQLRSNAGAFLQSYDESSGGWILVEFWTPNYQPFVDLLNRLIAEAEAKTR